MATREHLDFPVSLQLGGRTCLVVGSTAAVWQRARALTAAGADVRVVFASTPAAESVKEAAEHGWQLELRAFEPRDFDGVWLAVLTDEDAALAESMRKHAEGTRTFFCAVDQPHYGSFAHMGLSRAGSLTVAVGTSGALPALARRFKQQLDVVFREPRFVRLFQRLAQLRRDTPRAERRSVLEQALDDAGLRIVVEYRAPEDADEP